jgi:hypothetical protein
MASKRRDLDARTLRCVARRLRGRGRELDAKNKRNKALIGEPHNPYRTGRAMECYMQVDHLITEARAIERKSKASKGAKG